LYYGAHIIQYKSINNMLVFYYLCLKIHFCS